MSKDNPAPGTAADQRAGRQVGRSSPDIDTARGEMYVISVAAELTGMHAQTLRTYDRIGLVSPERTSGGGRRYSRGDVDSLREIQRLSQDEGVNLAGIKEIIRLNQENQRLLAELDATRAELEEERARGANSGRELVHVPRSTAVVMWQRRRRNQDH